MFTKEHADTASSSATGTLKPGGTVPDTRISTAATGYINPSIHFTSLLSTPGLRLGTPELGRPAMLTPNVTVASTPGLRLGTPELGRPAMLTPPVTVAAGHVVSPSVCEYFNYPSLECGYC